MTSFQGKREKEINQVGQGTGNGGWTHITLADMPSDLHLRRPEILSYRSAWTSINLGSGVNVLLANRPQESFTLSSSTQALPVLSEVKPDHDSSF
jgi:hypothetical protein